MTTLTAYYIGVAIGFAGGVAMTLLCLPFAADKSDAIAERLRSLGYTAYRRE